MADVSQAALVIFNLALSHVGNKQIATTDQSPVCQLHWPHVRDTLLTWFAWPWATTRARLAKLADEPLSGFRNQFLLPTEPMVLRILDINNSRFVPYKHELYYAPADPQNPSEVIATNADKVLLRYIARLDEGRWPEIVRDIAGLWLAARITPRTTGKGSLRGQLQAETDAMLQRAIDLFGHSDFPESVHLDNRYVLARDEGALESIPLEIIPQLLD